jgi:hypothetical protein
MSLGPTADDIRRETVLALRLYSKHLFSVNSPGIVGCDTKVGLSPTVRKVDISRA